MSQAELDALQSEYTRNFASRPRVTRNLALLDGLIGKLTPLAGAPGEIGASARASLETWRREAGLIAEIQRGGEPARRQHARNALLNMANRRYLRHYAGKSRPTRDLEMLVELADRAARWAAESADLAATWDHATFADTRRRLSPNAELYRREAQAVRDAIRSGSSDDRATSLATRANNQFRWYRLCFAGKDRNGRRLSQLERVVRELASVEAGMSELVRGGWETTAHRKNLDLVTSRLAQYRDEVSAIRRAQGDAGYAKVFEAVAKSANDLFAEYRKDFAGQARATRDPEALGNLCDQVFEVALNMDELDHLRGDAGNEANLLIVLEELSVYEAEIDRIKEARGESVGQPAARA